MPAQLGGRDLPIGFGPVDRKARPRLGHGWAGVGAQQAASEPGLVAQGRGEAIEERAARALEPHHLARERERIDVQHADREPLPAVPVGARLPVDGGEQGRRVRPAVKARVVLDQLEAVQRQRLAGAVVAQDQLVAHPQVQRIRQVAAGGNEDHEFAPLDRGRPARQPATGQLPPFHPPRVRGVPDPMLDIVERDAHLQLRVLADVLEHARRCSRSPPRTRAAPQTSPSSAPLS